MASLPFSVTVKGQYTMRDALSRVRFRDYERRESFIAASQEIYGLQRRRTDRLNSP